MFGCRRPLTQQKATSTKPGRHDRLLSSIVRKEEHRACSARLAMEASSSPLANTCIIMERSAMQQQTDCNTGDTPASHCPTNNHYLRGTQSRRSHSRPEKVSIINVLANATRHGASEIIVIKPRPANVNPIRTRVGDFASKRPLSHPTTARSWREGSRKAIAVKICFLHINPLPDRGGQCSRIFAVAEVKPPLERVISKSITRVR